MRKLGRSSLVVFSTTVLLYAVSSGWSYSGGAGTEANPYQIGTVSDWQQLMSTSGDWGKAFVLISDIDLAGVNLTPVGNGLNQFTGIVDGNDHVIRNIQISLPENDNVGLFGSIASGGQIINLGVENSNVVGDYTVGGLVAYNFGIVDRCYISGTVSGAYEVGALAGTNEGVIARCHSTASVFGTYIWSVGGLVGKNYRGTIFCCFATGNVSGPDDNVGGLVGDSSYGSINSCYATGAVNGHCDVGGLVGYNFGIIANCYATGAVNGNDAAGGLVGENQSSVTYSYATGSVSSNDYYGGVVGKNYCYVNSCIWNIQTSLVSCGIGYDDSGGSKGKTTAEMKAQSTFTAAGWDFVGESANGTADVWQMDPYRVDYPKLAWETIPVVNGADLLGWRQTGQEAYWFKIYDASTQVAVTQLKWGQRVQIKYTVKNVGNVTARPFHVNFYLSNDSIIGNAGDIRLGYAYWNNGLSARACGYKTSPVLTIPASMSGVYSEASTWYLGMRIDPNNVVAEASNSNNYNQLLGFDKCKIAQAARTITDNFNDNLRGAMWVPYADNILKSWPVETNGRLEIHAVRNGGEVAGYSSGFRIIPGRNFCMTVNYCNNIASADGSIVGLGLTPCGMNTEDQGLAFYVARDSSESYIMYQLQRGDDYQVEQDGYYDAPTSGKLYVYYSASEDQLYLSLSDKAGALWVIPELLKSNWGGKPVYVGLLGGGVNTVIGSGKMYLDNFSCTGLLGACKPYYYKEGFDDGVMSSLWLKSGVNTGGVYETGGRFEYRSTSAATNAYGAYKTKYLLDATRDFSCSVDFTQAMSNTSGDTAVSIAIGTSTGANKLTLYAGKNAGGKYFDYHLAGVVNGTKTAVRSADKGKLYITYTSATDALYLSWAGFGRDSTKWTISNLVKGRWGGESLVVSIGGYSNGVIVPAGKLYLDNFLISGEKK